MEQYQNKTHKFWLFCYANGEEYPGRQYLVETSDQPKEGKICRFTYLKVIRGFLPSGKVSMDSNEHEIRKAIGENKTASQSAGLAISQSAKDRIQQNTFSIMLEFTLEKSGGIKFVPVGRATVI